MALLDGWTYCPRCRSELERKEGRVVCPACGFVGYANSAPTACALCTDDEGRLLMVRRSAEPYRGCWDLPGGFLEEGEHPLAALHRELREETGLEIEPGEFLGAFMDWYSEDGSGAVTLNLYWLARVVGGEERPADDVDAIGWFAADELPAELAFTNIPLVLSAWREQHA